MIQGLLVVVALLGILMVVEHYRGVIGLALFRKEARQRAAQAALVRQLGGGGGSVRQMTADEMLAQFPRLEVPPNRANPAWPIKPGYTRTVWQWEPGPRETHLNWVTWCREHPNEVEAIRRLRDGLLAHPARLRLNDFPDRSHLEALQESVYRASNLAEVFQTMVLFDLKEHRLQSALEGILAIHGLIEAFADTACSAWGQPVTEKVALTAWEALQAQGWSDTQLETLQKALASHQSLADFGRTMALVEDSGLPEHWESSTGGPDSTALPGLPQDLNRQYRDFHWTTLRYCLEERFNWARSDPESWRSSWQALIEPVRSGFVCWGFLHVWKFAWQPQDELCRRRILRHYIDAANRAARDGHWLAVVPGELNGFGDRSESHGTRDDRSFERGCWTADGLWCEEPTDWYDRARFWLASADAHFESVYARAAEAEVVRELAVAAVAIKRFELREKRLPAKLDELVPSLLAGLPWDYMAGKPLRYRPFPDGSYLLYSVGRDGIDNGGDATADGADTYPVTLSVDCRDIVWPRVASDEDIREFEAKHR